jgi:hypothetical protein
MKVVLYTTDFEPITILELPLWLLEQLERQGVIRVAVMQPPKWVNPQTPVQYEPSLETVTIYCEKMRWRDDSVKTILVTPDEVLALTLRPEWLPGQLPAIQHYQKAIRHLTEQLIKAMRKD